MIIDRIKQQVLQVMINDRITKQDMIDTLQSFLYNDLAMFQDQVFNPEETFSPVFMEIEEGY
jgi:hypothetical protein